MAGVALSAVLVAPASAATRVYSENANRLGSSWREWGAVNVNGATITLTERENEEEYAYQDIAVPQGGGKWAFLVAYGKAESVRRGDITGRPNIYGYAMDSNGRILSYLQRPNMMVSGRSGTWEVLHGAFKLPAGTTSIRYFLQQAEQKGSAKYGDDATFYKPALYVVDTFATGRDLVNNYRFGLDLL